MRRHAIARRIVRDGWFGADASALSALVLLLFGACATLSTGGAFSALVERRDNGYVVTLPGIAEDIRVSAFVARNDWIIVTIVDPEYPDLTVQQVNEETIDSVEIVRFPSATQLSFHFAQPIERVDVIRPSGEDSAVMAVFRQRIAGEKRGR